MKNKSLIFILKTSFYLYIFFFWLKLVFLGRQLSLLQTPGEAVHILQNSHLFLVELVQVLFHSTGKELFPNFLELLSLPYITLVYIWFFIKDRHITINLIITWLCNVSILSLLYFILQQDAVGQAINYANILGIVILVCSLSMQLYTCLYYLKERTTLLEFND